MYYYCHHESECIWISDNPNETGDGLVVQTDEADFNNLDAMGYTNHGYTPTNTRRWAGIGARGTPADILEIMFKWGMVLARERYTCCTGACKGADQAFANGAQQEGGRVRLYLPWWNYEKSWVGMLTHNSALGGDPWGTVTKIVFKPELHPEANASVDKYHPNPSALKSSVRALHARNYLILDGVEFIICWTPNGQIVGGTGQALRIAMDRGIKIYNLGDQACFTAMTNRLLELGY